jgi:hypothetical protein
MQQALNFNRTILRKNNASSHDELDDNCLWRSVRLRRRSWRSITILFKRHWRVTLRRSSLATDPEKSSFFTALAVGLRSLPLVHPAGWDAAFQNGPGPPGNGPMRFGEGSMIETSCVSSRAQHSRVSGTSAMSVGILPRGPPQMKPSFRPFRPAQPQTFHLKQEDLHDSVRASPSDFRLHPCFRQAAQAADTRG